VLVKICIHDDQRSKFESKNESFSVKSVDLVYHRLSRSPCSSIEFGEAVVCFKNLILSASWLYGRRADLMSVFYLFHTTF
jgi:hypothetical protein